ncbi:MULTISPECIES: DUF6942 family protein [Pseudoalteromonas]|uniref:Uncharacterized protein n=1 Tax=Pseudoalteromonas obscura TaxID=3048491 RepID=A0ABT7ENW0_9GAMM|nr:MULTISPECIES: hypothetical protein [Pseudoalteromonas]MBQ4838083.1 hypothetical protein [Pseudoalteromonas luteoviolacea]MDK2596746.1 hypothetical protein [Pseudoalteromonas sp. P94(2023)]
MKILTHGFGAAKGVLAVYVERRPNLEKYINLQDVIPLQQGEIDYINQECGNGWRKLFNVYGKFIAQLQHPDHHFTNQSKGTGTWQHYRDNALLQSHSQEALLFSPPNLERNSYQWHIIAGRTYAKRLLRDHDFTHSMVWIDEEFAIDRINKVIVCPYFDYRQLSNIKITKLVELIQDHSS